MARLPFFPTPESGEPVHSGISRCACRSGISATDLLVYLTGTRSRATLLGMLPTCLNELALQLPEGHPWTDITYTVLNHTSLPFLTYFCGQDAKSAAIKLLASADRAPSVYGFLGLSLYPTSDWRRVHLWCTDCIAEDVRSLGFAIYHREHQVPGVLVCWKHHKVLSCGCKVCGSSPIPGCSLNMPGECLCGTRATALPIAKPSRDSIERLIWLAEQSAYILSSQWSHSCPRRILASALDLPEFCRGNHPSYRKIAMAIQRRYGTQCLGLLGYQAFRPDGEPSPWIRGSLRGSREERRTPSPALLLLLGLGVDSVERFESVDRGENGKRDRSTDPPMLVSEGNAIQNDLLPKTANGAFKSRFARDADRSEADRQLANAVRCRARKLKESEGRPTRITKTSLLKHFGQLSKFTLRKTKYPLTAKALEDVSERRFEFLDRKISWGLNTLKLEGLPLSMNVFRRLITTPAPVLYRLRERVTKLAAQLGIAVDERSMFALTHRGDGCASGSGMHNFMIF